MSPTLDMTIRQASLLYVNPRSKRSTMAAKCSFPGSQQDVKNISLTWQA